MLKVILIVVGIFIVGWFLVSEFSSSDQDILSKKGIHWHPRLTISILGENQDIPADIGMLPVEMPVHTHEEDGTIHLEFPGLVKKDDIRLGNFFEIWGKTFNKDCIFDKCSGSEGDLKMFINGKENFEFENYIMRDGDKIEIIFEKAAN